ncbi:ArnT family glycosyltransferase [Phormidesmis sp. 146-12]
MNRLTKNWRFNNIYSALGLLLTSYSVFALGGYGNDDDTYRMLNTWNTLISQGKYVSSRFQGYLIPEIAIGLASQIGGFFLANLVSVVLSVTTLFIFYRLLRRITTTRIAILSVLAIGVNPFWVIASATSIDYIYAAFFFVLGVFLLIDQKFRWAALIFAAAVSSRITYGPMVAIAYFLYFCYVQKESKSRRLLVQSFILFLVASVVFYLPVFFASGMTLSFLGIGPDASGGFVGIIARFVYKNIYFWGLPAFVLLGAFLFQERTFLVRKIADNPFQNTQAEKLIFYSTFLCVVYNQIMFFRLPHEYGYLFPVLFSVIYWIATSEKVRKVQYLSLLIALQIVYGLVFNFDVIQTYQTDINPKTIHSDSARVHFSIKEGVLIRDWQWRSIYQKYQLEEYRKKWGK